MNSIYIYGYKIRVNQEWFQSTTNSKGEWLPHYEDIIISFKPLKYIGALCDRKV
jgi:hypothetical protein